MIFILSGPIHTGKTTALKKWADNQKYIFGLLNPVDENGIKYFLTLPHNSIIKMEVNYPTQQEVIAIGPYIFLAKSFDTANQHLTKQLNHIEKGFVIIDELGKLEMKKQALYISTQLAIEKSSNNINLHTIIIIRDSLLAEALSFFKINDFILISRDTLDQLNKFTIE